MQVESRRLKSHCITGITNNNAMKNAKTTLQNKGSRSNIFVRKNGVLYCWNPLMVGDLTCRSFWTDVSRPHYAGLQPITVPSLHDILSSFIGMASEGQIALLQRLGILVGLSPTTCRVKVQPKTVRTQLLTVPLYAVTLRCQAWEEQEDMDDVYSTVERYRRSGYYPNKVESQYLGVLLQVIDIHCAPSPNDLLSLGA